MSTLTSMTRLASAILTGAALCTTSIGAHAQANAPYLGQIMCAPYNFVPAGWAVAAGQLMAISQNTALFSLLGTMYGGNGTTTFALPDLRGRFIMSSTDLGGASPGSGLHSTGEQGGSDTHTITTSEIPPHTHVVAPLGSTNDASSISPAGKAPASKARTTLYADPTPGTTMAATTTSATGGGQPIQTLPPYTTINCFIALQGVFPSRN